MNSGKMSVQRASILLASMLVGSSLFGAADDSVTAASSNSTSTVTAQSQDTEIAQLKAALAEQQKQLQSLQQAIQNQQQLIDKVSGTPSGTSSAPAQRNNLGNVASLTPVLPAPVPMPVRIAMPTPLRVLRAQMPAAAIPAKPGLTETRSPHICGWAAYASFPSALWI